MVFAKSRLALNIVFMKYIPYDYVSLSVSLADQNTPSLLFGDNIMALSYTLTFSPVDDDITDPVTKFGGQPTWLEAPQWPLSRELERPMRFIGQVALTDELMPGHAGQMAYLFMTDDDEDYVDDTWEPDGGENALILQPGGTPHVPCVAQATGPTLITRVSVQGQKRLKEVEQVYAAHTTPVQEPPFLDQDALATLDAGERSARIDALLVNKVGGTPFFIQADEFPDEDSTWRLLLQLDSANVPFSVNFGDAGVGYAFVSDDGKQARFLWQCM